MQCQGREQGFSEASTQEVSELDREFPETQVDTPDQWSWARRDYDDWSWGGWSHGGVAAWWSGAWWENKDWHGQGDRWITAHEEEWQAWRPTETPTKPDPTTPSTCTIRRSELNKALEASARTSDLSRAATITSEPPATPSSAKIPPSQPSPANSATASPSPSKRPHVGEQCPNPAKAANTGGAQAEWAMVQTLLQRGHTVDRLTDEELMEVASSISRLQKSRSQQQLEEPAASVPQQGAEQDKPGEPQGGNKPQENTGEPKKESKPQEDAGEPSKESKPQQESSAAAEDSKLQGQQAGDQETKAMTEEEAKLARKKKVHARYMRFSRSLTSSFADIILSRVLLLCLKIFIHQPYILCIHETQGI